MKITYETLAQIVGGIYFGSDVEMYTIEQLIEFLETENGYVVIQED